jgi:hypothetical protein
MSNDWRGSNRSTGGWFCSRLSPAVGGNASVSAWWMPNGRGGERFQKLIFDIWRDWRQYGRRPIISPQHDSHSRNSGSYFGRANDRRSEAAHRVRCYARTVGRRREFERTFHIIVCSPIVDKLAAMHDLSAFSIVQVRIAAFLPKRSLLLLLWGREWVTDVLDTYGWSHMHSQAHALPPLWLLKPDLKGVRPGKVASSKLYLG